MQDLTVPHIAYRAQLNERGGSLAFGGSASKLVMQALATRRASAEELTEIRRLIDGRDGREVRDERD